MFEKLKDLLRGSRHVMTLTSDDFPPVDKEKIKRELHIEENARQDGEKNTPLSNSDQRPPTEIAIMASLVGYQNQYVSYYNGIIRAIQAKYIECVNALDIDRIGNEEKARLDEARQEKTIMQGNLSEKSDKLLASAKELIAYRRKHNLMDRGPQTRDMYRMLTTILAAFVVETVVTVFLTREAGDLPTVATVVTLYCILNIGLPFAAAVLTKWIYYTAINTSHSFKKAAGVGALLLLIAWIVMLNLGMGHYRSAGLTFTAVETESLAGLLGNISRQQYLIWEAWQNFVANPFAINEILSALLVALGCVLALLALYEGTTWNDAYPNYGNLAKKYENNYEVYQASIENYIDSINEIRESAIIDVNKSKVDFSMSLVEIPKIVSRSSSIHQNFIQANKKLSEDHAELLSFYRHENIKSREDMAPDFFNTTPTLDVPQVEFYEPERVDKEVDKGSVLSHIDGIAQDIHKEIDKITQSIPSADQVIDEVGYPLRIES